MLECHTDHFRLYTTTKAPTNQSAFYELFYRLPQCFKSNEDQKDCSHLHLIPDEQSLK